jgi:hypothetical protein
MGNMSTVSKANSGDNQNLQVATLKASSDIFVGGDLIASGTVSLPGEVKRYGGAIPTAAATGTNTTAIALSASSTDFAGIVSVDATAAVPTASTFAVVFASPIVTASTNYPVIVVTPNVNSATAIAAVPTYVATEFTGFTCNFSATATGVIRFSYIVIA